ncbi:hypothetical protein H5410_044805 [Solanum commersonii]|uniref:Uncharacterized protein n=1 Tax=Solanum commersonii TaxID=4109 RepID=A0A9J5X7Z4_SOLCO|nr:hypothetical protein H5410_044805 [Solanum commersonii]
MLVEAHWGRDIDEPSRVNILKSLGFNYSSTHQSHNASTHVAPQSGYTISTPFPNTPPPDSDAHAPPAEAIETILETRHRAIRIQCIETHYNGVYPNWSSIPLNTQGQMFNEFKALFLKHWNLDEKFKRGVKLGRWLGMRRKREALLHSVELLAVTRKERMAVAVVREMFKVTHARRVTNPREEERWIEPACSRDIWIESRRTIYTRRKRESLETKSLVNRLEVRSTTIEACREEEEVLYCGSSSSSFDGGDRDNIAMESKITYLNARASGCS